jgi:hypothetical protein
MRPQKTYDYPDSRSFKLTLSIVCSLFIYVFLLFFQPFGVNNYQPSDKIGLELVLGILWIVPALFLTLSFNEFVLRPILIKKHNFTTLMPWFVYQFIAMGTSSFLIYNALGNFHDFYWSSFVKHVLEISSVLVFPFVGTLFYFNYRKVAKNYDEIVSISNGIVHLDEIVLLRGDYKNDQIAIRPKNVIYIKSEDNYLGLFLLEQGKVKKYLIRATLNHFEHILKSPLFVRCNRSSIVNLYHLETANQQSGNLMLKLQFIDEQIKVSKSNRSTILEKLDNNRPSVDD